MTRNRLRALALLLCAPLLGACGDNDDNGDAGTNGNGSLDGGVGTDGSPFDGCVEVTQSATNVYGPVDIVFAIDNSPSLEDEIAEVRANMNAFAASVVASGLDARIVMISCLPGDCDGHPNNFGVCIDAPLGAVGGCDEPPPYDDTNLPGYLHVDRRIPSQKVLERIVDTYPDWSSMIRPDSTVHFVVVSDDTDELSAADFHSALIAADSTLEGYFFHGIFAFLGKEDACAISGTQPCCTYAAPGGEGVPYRDLVNQSGGEMGDLCLQDFDPVFAAVATTVLANAELSCEWTIPPPPEGEDLDPSAVNVEFVDGDAITHSIGMVPLGSDCDDVTHGWFYDDPSSPTTVYVCPQTCTWIQGDSAAQIKIKFGCETELAPVL